MLPVVNLNTVENVNYFKLIKQFKNNVIILESVVAGKILESLSARALGMGLRPSPGPAGPSSPGSGPPTPPRTPLSPHKAASSPVSRSYAKTSSVETMAAKFAGLASNNNSRVSGII